jgi:glycosyltransferase involved in cell wall biosynthesis
MKITSPMATGNGAYVVHKTLEKHIANYQVIPYSPYRTLMPLLLSYGLKDQQANIIHTTPDYAYFFAQSCKPLVLTFHNFVLDNFMQNHSSFLQKIHYKTDLKWFTNLAVQNATCMTAVSHFTANLAKENLNLKKEIKVIYNGIDTNFFIPKFKFKNNKKINVLFCGNLTRRKGAHLLPKICEKLSPNITISYTSGLRTKDQFFQHSQLKCLGKINYVDMPMIYQQSDILLFPTIREGFGLAAAEAMACGLPIVATNCSSLPELVDDKGGFLCALENIDEFAEKINLLAENSLLRQQMGEYNRAKAEQKFTLSKMLISYQNLFTEILDMNAIL